MIPILVPYGDADTSCKLSMTLRMNDKICSQLSSLMSGAESAKNPKSIARLYTKMRGETMKRTIVAKNELRLNVTTRCPDIEGQACVFFWFVFVFFVCLFVFLFFFFGGGGLSEIVYLYFYRG